MRPAPGTALADELLGAAHLLVRRVISDARGLPEAAVEFEEPLHTRRGTVAVGSDLYHPPTLRQLLTWANPSKRPELAVVLVDCDGEYQRRQELAVATHNLRVRNVIGMAIQEFESWLIADQSALANALGTAPPYPGPPEGLKPREAKNLLTGWCTESGRDRGEIRRAIASTCDLGELRRLCPAFAELCTALANIAL